jgi:NTP pyrophosphatase (non-canonical NTP hydrolase)
MNLNEFSEKNRQRCETTDGFNHRLTDWSVSDWLVAVLGELGEAANVVKKLNRVRDGVAGNKETEAELQVKLVRELADAFIYLDLTFQRLGLRTEEVVREVFNAKSEQINSPIRV